MVIIFLFDTAIYPNYFYCPVYLSLCSLRERRTLFVFSFLLLVLSTPSRSSTSNSVSSTFLIPLALAPRSNSSMVSRAGAFTVRTFCFLTSSAKVTYARLRKSVQFGKIELYAARGLQTVRRTSCLTKIAGSKSRKLDRTCVKGIRLMCRASERSIARLPLLLQKPCEGRNYRKPLSNARVYRSIFL